MKQIYNFWLQNLGEDIYAYITTVFYNSRIRVLHVLCPVIIMGPHANKAHNPNVQPFIHFS